MHITCRILEHHHAFHFYQPPYFTPGKRWTCTPSVYYRKSIWPVSADQLTCINKRRIGLLSLMWAFIFISILIVNRRMTYAAAMNIDNTDTDITWKKTRISSDITFGISKRCTNLAMLYNLTLLCRLLSIKIKVLGIKCLLKILLVIGYASIPRHRPKTSGRNIWPVASNLTSGIHCVIVFHLIVLEFGIGQLKLKNKHIQSENKFICRSTILYDIFRNNCNSASSFHRPLGN